MADWSKNKRFSAETYFYLEYHKLHGKSISFSGFSFLYSEGGKCNKSCLSNGILSERKQRVWDFPNKLKRANGYSFAVLAPYSKQGRTGKEWKENEKSKTGISW